MILLKRPSKPSKLTDEYKTSKTLEFKETKKNVWNVPFIKEALLEFSEQKCAYCECNLIARGTYMEVEHFHDKTLYPEEVLLWDNLLPSCKTCNTKKSTLDTKKFPIIDPTCINPKNHFKIRNYYLRGKDYLGQFTIDRLNLNDFERLLCKRAQVGTIVQEKIENLNDQITEITEDNLYKKKGTRLINAITDLLSKGLPSQVYSATIASIIINDLSFKELKQKAIEKKLWNNEHDTIMNKILEIALDIDS